MTNAERQKKYRERRKAELMEYRKGVGVSPERSVERVDPAQSGDKQAMLKELRRLTGEASKQPVEPVAKLLVYRDDYGRVISERAYRALQKLKESAKNGGYELDEYSQF